MGDIRAYFVALPGSRGESAWRPSVDIYQCRDGWLVKCDLAGVRPQDVRVSMAGRQLSIVGVRRDSTLVEGHRAYSMEISYSRFERTLELPADLTGSRLSMEYHDGMLLIFLHPEKAS
jgi:HSP20 family protein